MFTNMFLRSSFRRSENSSRKLRKAHCSSRHVETKEFDLQYPATLKTAFIDSSFPLHDDDPFESDSQSGRHVEVKGKRRNKDSAGSCLVQRAASSCLLNPLFSCLRSSGRRSTTDWSDGEEEEEEEEVVEERRRKQTEILGVVIDEVFDAVRSIQKACLINLQEADVAELRRLMQVQGANMVMHAPIDVKIEVLMKLATTLLSGYGKRCRSSSNNKASCYRYGNVAVSPAPELFKEMATQVREASKSFGSILLSLMHHAHWDIPAVVNAITAATGATTFGTTTVVVPQAKYALESFVSRKFFQGFNHETYNLVNETSFTFNTEHNRFQCFTQYLEMKSMDPMELLAASPNCGFGKFCVAKYVAVVHPKMEESLFGSLKQHRLVMGGGHPKTEFYREFLRLAKSVWLLHLLAFSLDQDPSPFEASQGAKFCPQYMESVVGGLLPMSCNVVGFPLGPGFKLGDGSIIKARVYLVS